MIQNYLIWIIILILILNINKKPVENIRNISKNKKVLKKEFTLIGYLKNSLDQLDLYKLYQNNCNVKYYYYKNNKFYLIPCKFKNKENIKISGITYKVFLFKNDFYFDNYEILNKYNLNIPYIIEDYRYIGTLKNPYITGNYYIYSKQINFNLKLYNYLIFRKRIDNKFELVNTLNYKPRYQIGDALNVRVGGPGYYGTFFLSP